MCMEAKACRKCFQKCGVRNRPVDAHAMERHAQIIEADAKEKCIAHVCPNAATSAFLAHEIALESGHIKLPAFVPFSTWDKGIFVNMAGSSREILVAPGDPKDGEVSFVLGKERVVCTDLFPYIEDKRRSQERFKKS